MKNLIVSSADQKYSHLLKELYLSIETFLDDYDFAILDCGIDKSTINFFKTKNIQVVKPNWEFPIPEYKIRGRENLKVQFSRFFLDSYFPGYETYIWLDSDTWVNNFENFDLYRRAANFGGFSITPQVDRSYKKLIDIKWFLNFPKKINSINFKNISKSISTKLGKKFAGYFTLNAGCFAYSANFDGIKKIRSNLELCSKKGRVFGSDQSALALTLFEDQIEFELLPSYCNWLCETKLPKYSIEDNCYVEPYTPHTKIGIIHLAGMDQDRKEQLKYHKIMTLDGQILDKHLRFHMTA